MTATKDGVNQGGEGGKVRTVLRSSWPRLLVLAAVALLLVLIVLFRGQLSQYEKLLNSFGYLGVLLITFAGSASVLFPLPGFASVLAGGVLLNSVLLVGLVAGTGEAFGELVGYGLGYGGRGVIENRKFYQRVVPWVQRQAGIVVFVMSVIPNPLFDIVGIAAGGLRYPVWKFFLLCLAGKSLKNLAFAYAGSLGAGWLLGLVGRFMG